MSADDTILIISFIYKGRRVYVVIHCQAAENFYESWDFTMWYIGMYLKTGEMPEIGCREIKEYRGFTLYSKYSDAWDEANRIETELDVFGYGYGAEYGIVYLDTYKNKVFDPEVAIAAKHPWRK